jgi:hypothetical protein
MATIEFSGVDKTITLGYDGPLTEFTAADIYSRWKDWVKDGNAQFQPAFGESVGGNELGGGVSLSGYYFVRNDLGWRIVHSEYDYQIQITGDLYPSDPLTPFVDTTIDPYSVQFIFQRSAASYVSFGEATIPTTAQIAEAVWDELMSDHPDPGTFGQRLRNLFPSYWGV